MMEIQVSVTYIYSEVKGQFILTHYPKVWHSSVKFVFNMDKIIGMWNIYRQTRAGMGTDFVPGFQSPLKITYSYPVTHYHGILSMSTGRKYIFVWK